MAFAWYNAVKAHSSYTSKVREAMKGITSENGA